MRRADFGKPYCPEFSLRYPPRITVRGQTVQGGSVPLRKAPLRSRACPWSTKRPCGPLAFRRATEGSRVQRKMRGSQEGDKKPFGVLSPSYPLPWARRTPVGGHRQSPPPPGGGNAHAMSWRTSPIPGGPLSPAAAGRRNGGKAYPLLRGKVKKDGSHSGGNGVSRFI